MMRTRIAFALAFSALAAASFATDALTNSVSTSGNQAWTGPLGLDFNVSSTSNLKVTRLGAFDSGLDGLRSEIRVGIFNRDTGLLVGETFLFGTADPLVGAWRMQVLTNPFTLAAGGHYSVVALGYGANEQNFNTHGSGSASTDNGGSYLSFVGSSRYDGAGWQLPTTVDGGPSIRYGAGTFSFEPVPEPFTMALGCAGLGLAFYRRKRSQA